MPTTDARLLPRVSKGHCRACKNNSTMLKKISLVLCPCSKISNKLSLIQEEILRSFCLWLQFPPRLQDRVKPCQFADWMVKSCVKDICGGNTLFDKLVDRLK